MSGTGLHVPPRQPPVYTAQWRYQPDASKRLTQQLGAPCRCYVHPSLRVVVLSAIEEAEYPDGSGQSGLQWHVSLTGRDDFFRPVRATELQLDVVRRAFDMVEAEEDNHQPGKARNLWLPVDPARRVDCECKTTEVTITEPDGYQWTNPTDGTCRGCELERALPGRPCPIHTAANPHQPPADKDGGA